MLYDTGNEPGPSRVPPLGEISPGLSPGLRTRSTMPVASTACFVPIHRPALTGHGRES